MCQAMLLAAGASSRLWPLGEERHKSLFAMMGKPLVGWTLEALERAGVTEVLAVQRPTRDVEAALARLEPHLNLNLDVKTVVQAAPKGMGDALLCARDHLDEAFFVLHAHQWNADRWIAQMLAKRRETGAKMILAGQPTREPWKYGMLRLAGDRVMGIVEKPNPEAAPSDIRALGVYLLPRDLLEVLSRVDEHEYAFEEALDRYMKENDARVVLGEEMTSSLKYPWDLFASARRLMDEHLRPYRAPTARISPLAHLEGDVYVGENVRVFEYAVVKGPCYLGDGCVIGNHALVREYTDLERGVTIGAHAEVARSLFQESASTHSGYFGDSIFDRESRAGAGTVTANVKVHRDEVYTVVKGERVPTGLHSFGTVVGADTQLGINVSTMPGVLVGARSFVGPGVVVDENVPSDTRYIVKQEKLVKAKRSRRS